MKVCVFGAGVFAGYHAQKVAAHPRAVLAGIYDPDALRATALSQRLAAPIFDTTEKALDACDAIICAVPAVYHKTVAIPALASGKHALVEKPMADNVEAAEAILMASQATGAIVQIGHQERIVAEAIGLHRIPVRPTGVEIVRNSGRTTRNLDASVVMDLMIHDLDLLTSLFGQPDWATAEAARCVYSDHLDAVRAEVGYGDFTAYVASNRDAAPARRWLLRYEDGTVDIDFAAKTLRHDTPFDLNACFGDSPEVIDSLAAAFDRFVRACLDGAPVLCTARDGLEAVRLAAAIEDSA